MRETFYMLERWSTYVLIKTFKEAKYLNLCRSKRVKHTGMLP